MPSSSAYQPVQFDRQDQTTITPMISSSKNVDRNRISKKSSRTTNIDEIRTTEIEGEKRELNLLNNRFGNYLDKIKHLAQINAHLHRQVDDAYRIYLGPTDGKSSSHPIPIQLTHLRERINEEVRAQTSIQIRLQRAEYDLKFYQNNIKIFAQYDQQQSQQVQLMRQQLQFTLEELQQLKEQYQKREEDLQNYQKQYNENIGKLIEFSNNYDQITYERIQSENGLHTLKEQVTFEQEYHQRRLDELKYFERFHTEFHRDFHQKEFHEIVRKIREDYREFNAIHLSELETLYQTKLETVRQDLLKREEKQEPTKSKDVHQAIDSTKKEHRTLIEQNHLLKDKLEQLEQDLNVIIEQNRQRYEIAEREYQQLQLNIPELDCIIVHLRENAVNLWSEINTYRYLLLNLLSNNNNNNDKPSSKDKKVVSTTRTTTVATKAQSPSNAQQYRDETTGFVVHIEDGIIWVRI